MQIKLSKGVRVLANRSTDTNCLYFRLRVEIEDWKAKNLKLTEELNQVKAQYKEMERKVEESREQQQMLTAEKDQLSAEHQSLSERLNILLAENKYDYF